MVYLLSAFSALAQTAVGAAAPPAVKFAAAVPPAPAQMQIYKLAPTGAPLDFFNEKLSAIKLPALHLEQKAYVARGTTGETDRDRVRAFANPVSGDAHFVPNLADLVNAPKPAQPVSRESMQSVAQAALKDVRFIPKDATEVKFGDPITVKGAATTLATATPDTATAWREPNVVMTMVPAIRMASGLPVYGVGSHAVVSLANDGSIVGALRRWRTASLGSRIKTSITAGQVRADIARQLRPYISETDTGATVDRIELAYYDGNANYLQPVYYFEATVEPANTEASSIGVAGYVPIGKVLEPIPDLASTGGTGGTTTSAKNPIVPADPTQASQQVATGFLGNPADITLGEYVNQDWPNNTGYVKMANAFLSGLTELDAQFPGLQPAISRTQWDIAYPSEVVGPSSRFYLNAVNIAYTVPHGNWLVNTTKSNNADSWHVKDIGTGGNPGFGAAAGGVLATWIIMSCEVIPSVYDRQNEAKGGADPSEAFTPWWPVFQGLHNAIGFRTIMLYPEDGLQRSFALDASLGGDLTAAWFHELAANYPNPGTYHDKNLQGAPLVHQNRGSTMVDARDLGQSIYNVSPQSASTTLWNFWMEN